MQVSFLPFRGFELAYVFLVTAYKVYFLHYRGHINIVSSCDITNDERKFATGSWDKNICIWDIATGTYRSKGPVKLCAGHEGSISCCRFSPDGNSVILFLILVVIP